MPRYYFHFQDGSSLVKDEAGEIFADAPRHWSMQSGSLANWSGAANRRMPRSRHLVRQSSERSFFDLPVNIIERFAALLDEFVNRYAGNACG